jgi:putative hydrolase of the HAD superfamily
MFVFFDIDGTLLDDEYASSSGITAFYEAHKDELPAASKDSFLRDWADCTEVFFNQYLAGELTFQGQRRARLKKLFARDLSDEEADRFYQEYYDLFMEHVCFFPDAEKCLAVIEQRGIISNGNSVSQRDKVNRLGLADNCDPILISGDIDAPKPDPRIFAEACRLSGREPRECLYVGDRPETDALGAQQAGWTGVWINRHKKPNRPEGIQEITSLEELPALVTSLG